MYVVSRVLYAIFFSAIVFFSGCAHYNDYVKEERIKAACHQACHEKHRLCQTTCFDNCPLCCAKQNSNTQTEYNNYKRQQIIQGKPIIRQLKSYRDPLQCSKISCDCMTDHAICLQSCTKKAPKKLQLSQSC